MAPKNLLDLYYFSIMELEQTRDELLLEIFEIAKADGNSEPLTKSVRV